VIEIKDEPEVKKEIKAEVKSEVKAETKKEEEEEEVVEVVPVVVSSRRTGPLVDIPIFHDIAELAVKAKATPKKAAARKAAARKAAAPVVASTRPQRGVPATTAQTTLPSASSSSSSSSSTLSATAPVHHSNNEDDKANDDINEEQDEDEVEGEHPALGETPAQQGEYVGQRDAEGRPHGQGVMTYTTNLPDAENRLDRKRKGNKYTGQWLHGRKHGQGRLDIHTLNTFDKATAKTNFNCDVYVGPFVDDLFHGQGVYTYNCGDRYEGTFDKGVMTGAARYVATSGAVYVGKYENFSRNGVGTMTYHDGEYRGEWKGGKRHGQGRMAFTADKRAYEGQWKNDNPCKWKGEGWTKL
jgi:hypothetical protein